MRDSNYNDRKGLGRPAQLSGIKNLRHTIQLWEQNGPDYPAQH